MTKSVRLQIKKLTEREKASNTKEISTYFENILHFGKNSVLKYSEVCHTN